MCTSDKKQSEEEFKLYSTHKEKKKKKEGRSEAHNLITLIR